MPGSHQTKESKVEKYLILEECPHCGKRFRVWSAVLPAGRVTEERCRMCWKEQQQYHPDFFKTYCPAEVKRKLNPKRVGTTKTKLYL